MKIKHPGIQLLLPGACRLPCGRLPLSLGNLLGGHKAFDPVAILGGSFYTPSGGEVEPHICLNIVLWHPSTQKEPTTKDGLGGSVSLLSRFTEPTGGFPLVLRHALTPTVHNPEHALRHSVSLIDRLAIPTDGFRIVLRNTATLVVACAKSDLRIGESLLGRFAEPADGFRVVLRNTATLVVPRAKERLRHS